MREDDFYIDEWGVTYSSQGRILMEVNPQLFSCEEYTIPEGVEIMEGTFWLANVKPKRVVLPSTLQKMECNTFIRCPLKELVLPEGITIVPGCMCEQCEELKRVVLPSTIKSIEICAFNCCVKLQEINLPDNIEYVEDGIFRFCNSLTQLHLPSNLRGISPEMFYGSGILSIEIPASVTEICYWAFWGCNQLKNLIIPESVKRIEYGIVSAHKGFEGIICHAKGYHIENDALINDERQELLCCWTQQKNYIVPESVRRIADMSGNEFLESIIVKQPVELTTYDVFASDTNLKRVDFQGGVKGLTEYTFWNCPKLEKEKYY